MVVEMAEVGAPTVPKLDKEAFKQVTKLAALKVQCRDTTKVVKGLAEFLLKVKGQRSVVPDLDDPKQFRRVLLDPDQVKPEVDQQEWPSAVANFSEVEITPVSHELVRSYAECSVQEVLTKILPAGVEVPLSFETVGHIAHFNLRECHEPYKYIIGQVVLDKNRGLKTVVTKTHELDSENEFRVFPMEVIAGEDNTLTTVKEQGLTFELDYRDVYWNSRLSQERQRVKGLIPVQTRVLDMFAGAGAMSCFLAHQGTEVMSNDLNPKGAKWMEINRKRNKMESNMTVYNQCARVFVKTLQAGKNVLDLKDDGVKSVHCIMNLPALALDFLDTFRGVCQKTSEDQQLCAVKIHCYCFARASPPDSEIHPRIEAALGVLPEGVTWHLVRDVAPNKKMYCVEFTVPEPVLREKVVEEPEAKRQRTD